MLRKDGTPWPLPPRFDVAIAALDSGIKGGVTHDASAVVYLAVCKYAQPQCVYVIDWEAVELGAGSLEQWFKGVIVKHTKLARTRAKARGPSMSRTRRWGRIATR